MGTHSIINGFINNSIRKYFEKYQEHCPICKKDTKLSEIRKIFFKLEKEDQNNAKSKNILNIQFKNFKKRIKKYKKTINQYKEIEKECIKLKEEIKLLYFQHRTLLKSYDNNISKYLNDKNILNQQLDLLKEENSNLKSNIYPNQICTKIMGNKVIKNMADSSNLLSKSKNFNSIKIPLGQNKIWKNTQPKCV